jgi:hypothetical protein
MSSPNTLPCPETPMPSTASTNTETNTDTPTRARWLLLLALLAAVAMALRGPIAQWAGYHQFADTRSAWGLPNAADVLSNIPFALIGAWGLWRLRHQRTAASGAWRVFSLAVTTTALGSAAYHWQPNNLSLVFDRLPIAWACSALLCAFLAERVSPRWGRPLVLSNALVLASVSVAWWWLGERQGAGDLRLYLYVQFLPLLLVPAGLLLRLPAQTAWSTSGVAWAAALGLYVVAKGLEMADHPVLHALGFISGHTLKHLFAAGAAAWLLHSATRGRG